MQSVSSSHLYGVRVHPMRATERLDVSAAQLPSLRQRFGAGTRHVPLRFLLARLLRLMFVGSGFRRHRGPPGVGTFGIHATALL